MQVAGNPARAHDRAREQARSSSRRGRLLLSVAAVMLVGPVGAAAASPPAPPYANGHAYRHGAVPRRGLQHAPPLSTTTTGPDDVAFGGGIGGVGVTTGPEQVYLVFWGSQWGLQTSNSSGYASFSGDPNGVAPDLQAFFKGLGTNNETWSGVPTQYCQGVSTGAFSCPASNTEHVAYPAGGALAGVWEDTSSAAPSAASGHQLAQEAEKAASHFGNTTTASNRDAQYVIVSPTGTDPDSYETQGFCAWHDYSGDSTLDGGGGASGPTLAFTNLPYIPNAGSGCGQNFVNSGSAGTLDGVTIVEGHEYTETITDQFPAGGWTTPSGADAGEEVGDLCAWVSSGQGAATDLSLSTGSFAVQSIWANDYNGGGGGCETSHPIVTNPGNAVTVTNPGNQTSTVGTPASLQVQASDSASGQTLTYSASGLPAGLAINSSTGLISGTPTTASTSSVTVKATDTTGASGSASFTWTVNAASGCVAAQLLGNPGFETGSAAPWTSTAGVINPNGAGETAHSGNWYAWLDGYGYAHTDTLAQKVTVSGSCHTDTFGFWLWIDSSEIPLSAVDTLKVQVLNSSGTVLATLATYSNLNANNQYVHKSFNLSAYAGQTITLKFTGKETDGWGGTTDFVIDDTSLTQAP